ncbi:MAG: hypothetical protein Q9167_001535 [Letrouitia subvulpina]
MHPIREDFFQDLANFIPVGSLTIKLYGPQSLGNVSIELFDHLVPPDFVPFVSQKWIRIFASRHPQDPLYSLFRIYVLPADIGRRYLQRDSHDWARLRNVLKNLNASSDAWEGVKPIDQLGRDRYSDDLKDADQKSLFYLFNTLPSPAILPSNVSCSFAKNAILSLLDDSTSLFGLRTKLFAYQRRSAAAMIKRETEPALALDPRLETLRGPDGRSFYYDQTTGLLLRQPRFYDQAKGGILAETMGFGKTLICLATILATRGHWPQIPPEYSLGRSPARPEVGSLLLMAAVAINRELIPWKTFLQEHASQGFHYMRCETLLSANTPSYIIPAPEARRSRRPATIRPGKLVTLSTTTLVIVPLNLFSHWRNEIETHLSDGALQILYVDNNDFRMPSADTISKYDMIVMSKQRFEQEMSLKSDLRNVCKCTADKRCRCSPDGQYHSPLEDIHFLRVIVDEGHDFASFGRKNNAVFALQKVHVDRRWIVSGTPSPGLLGVEISTAVQETFGTAHSHNSEAIQRVLESRKTGFIGRQNEPSVRKLALLQERKDLERLGSIVTDFLSLKPWANVKGGEDPASWRDYILPAEDGRRKPKSLKALLESLVVRHRIEDIELEMELPPLHNHTIYLQPKWQETLSINLFILGLAVNAVTSERVDQDYVFHPKNRASLNQLITNLRQSAFYWTGLMPEEVQKSIEVSNSYMEKHGYWDPSSNRRLPSNKNQKDDFLLLEEAIQVGRQALDAPSWIRFTQVHEIGFYVENFPEESIDVWSLIKRQPGEPLLIGATQLREAQSYVDAHLYSSNPIAGLAACGLAVAEKLRQDVELNSMKAQKLSKPSNSSSKEVGVKSPRSVKKPQYRGFRTISQAKVTLRSSKAPSLSNSCKQSVMGKEDEREASQSLSKPVLKPALKPTSGTGEPEPFPPDSPLLKARICGTASAKLSYLLDRVSSLYQSEKILIFYEGNNIAYYIAQAFDLLDISYLIYTGSLSTARKSAYIATFNTSEDFRVLLMDVHQAAHGLHIASASRVFFVNPVWQPNVEAQAIKRAHRIGQTRPVYVETLVLKDTIEDHMLQRRKRMSAEEHQKAEKSLLDDSEMEQLLKNVAFIPLDLNGGSGSSVVSQQMAEVKVPQQIFGRQKNIVAEVPCLPRKRKELGAEEPSKPKKRVGFVS